MSPVAPRDATVIGSYHAHIYYDPGTRDAAARLRGWIGAGFPVQLGRWHEAPVGPHPQAMYQVAFGTEVFPALLPWLMLNRLGLTVLVHPNTGDAVADHLQHAVWLGGFLPLDPAALRD